MCRRSDKAAAANIPECLQYQGTVFIPFTIKILLILLFISCLVVPRVIECMQICAFWLDPQYLVGYSFMSQYVNMTTVQDIHGLTLLAYVAGINSLRSSKLLDVLINSSPRRSVALVTCARREGSALTQEDVGAKNDGALIASRTHARSCRIDTVAVVNLLVPDNAMHSFGRANN